MDGLGTIPTGSSVRNAGDAAQQSLHRAGRTFAGAWNRGNTAIYSFMDAILLRALPVSDPQYLVMLRWHTRGSEMHGMGFHDDDYLSMRRRDSPAASFHSRPSSSSGRTIRCSRASSGIKEPEISL